MSAATDTRPQHLVAFEKANHVRVERAALRREVAALPEPEGRLKVARLLERPPESIVGMRIMDLLGWPHRMGLARARRILRPTLIYEGRTVAQMTERQRRLLAGTLTGMGR